MTSETSEPSEPPQASGGGSLTSWLMIDLVIAACGLAMVGIGLAFFDWRIALIVVGTIVAVVSYWSN